MVLVNKYMGVEEDTEEEFWQPSDETGELDFNDEDEELKVNDDEL